MHIHHDMTNEYYDPVIWAVMGILGFPGLSEGELPQRVYYVVNLGHRPQCQRSTELHLAVQLLCGEYRLT